MGYFDFFFDFLFLLPNFKSQQKTEDFLCQQTRNG